MSTAQTRRATIYGRVVLTAEIHALTGLRIGGAAGGLAIGALDNPVVRDILTGQPYIPGSSLKGKLRSLSERIAGLETNWRINNVYLHICTGDRGSQANPGYESCPVCPVFGVPGDQYPSAPTRLVVRDVPLTDESVERLRRARTDLPFTEIKWEAAIDRVTSAAVPRQVERVPAGAVFAPAELVFTIYDPVDFDRFRTLARALQLLEDDYLGSYGSRGSGKVVFRHLVLTAKSRASYDKPEIELPQRTFDSCGDLLREIEDVVTWLRGQIAVEGR